MTTHFVYYRTWFGLTERFPFAEFDAIRDDQVLAHRRQLAERWAVENPDALAEWRRQDAEEWARQERLNSKRSNSSGMGRPSVRPPRREPVITVLRPDPMEEVENARGWRARRGSLQFLGADKKPVSPGCGPRTYFWSVNTERKDELLELVAVLANRHGVQRHDAYGLFYSSPPVTRFWFENASQMDRATALTVSLGVKDLHATSEARTAGRFLNRLIVDCEALCAEMSPADRPSVPTAGRPTTESEEWPKDTQEERSGLITPRGVAEILLDDMEITSETNAEEWAPASFFPAKMHDRLRRAVSEDRKTMHVRKKVEDGVHLYHCGDARKWWPGEVPPKPGVS